MIVDTVRSFSLVNGLQNCPKIIVCDGYKVTSSKAHYKKSKITAEDEARYKGFIAALIDSVNPPAKADRASPPDLEYHTFPSNGHDGSLPHNTLILPLRERSGFAQAVRAGLEHVKTTFVMVVQHDQQFIRGFNLYTALTTMSLHPDKVKYLGLPSKSTTKYASKVLSKFGVVVEHTEEFNNVRLLPLIFFYDKPHICSVAYYREFVFAPG
jgi:hypothetical protein